ncbi:MAG: hypothetical protein CMM81_00110 [Rhodospirillales bacterium]|nr:hypothetical protein [Rhodospirillales bacterium]
MTMLRSSLLGFLALLAGISTPDTAQAQAFSTYCGPASPPSHTLMLIDQTENFDTIDMTRFAEGFNRIFQELIPGNQLDIYLIAGQPGALTRAFSSCIPGCPDEIESGNSNWQHICSNVLIQRDKRLFVSAFTKFMNDLNAASAVSDATHLINTLENLAYQYSDSSISDFYIFSDMLEYSPLNYKINAFDFTARQALERKARGVIPENHFLANATVTAFGFGKRLGQQSLIEEKGYAAALLPSGTATQFRAFWTDFFKTTMPTKAFRLSLEY